MLGYLAAHHVLLLHELLLLHHNLLLLLLLVHRSLLELLLLLHHVLLLLIHGSLLHLGHGASATHSVYRLLHGVATGSHLPSSGHSACSRSPRALQVHLARLFALELDREPLINACADTQG